MKFLQPLIELRRSLPEGATLDDLIKANVKKGVEEICQTEVGSRGALSGGMDVHG